jgi:polysaccharide pyruvyl transferase WcaK-like protein
MSKMLISKCNLAIGGRYHFLVFAMTAGTPCVGMAGNQYSVIKQNGFSKMIGKEHFIIDTSSPSPEVMKSILDVSEQALNNGRKKLYFHCNSLSLFRNWFSETFNVVKID